MLEEGPYDVLCVLMTRMNTEICVYILKEIELVCFVIEVAHPSRLVPALVMPAESLLVLKIGLGDNVWLTIPRIHERFLFLMHTQPASKLMNVVDLTIKHLFSPEHGITFNH